MDSRHKTGYGQKLTISFTDMIKTIFDPDVSRDLTEPYQWSILLFSMPEYANHRNCPWYGFDEDDFDSIVFYHDYLCVKKLSHKPIPILPTLQYMKGFYTNRINNFMIPVNYKIFIWQDLV